MSGAQWPGVGFPEAARPAAAADAAASGITGDNFGFPVSAHG